MVGDSTVYYCRSSSILVNVTCRGLANNYPVLLLPGCTFKLGYVGVSRWANILCGCTHSRGSRIRQRCLLERERERGLRRVCVQILGCIVKHSAPAHHAMAQPHPTLALLCHFPPPPRLKPWGGPCWRPLVFPTCLLI